jgi:hypothetical protein
VVRRRPETGSAEKAEGEREPNDAQGHALALTHDRLCGRATLGKNELLHIRFGNAGI